MVVCHAFLVAFFARHICDDGWHFVDFHARMGCDHPHHKLAISNISKYTALDSTKNVGGWIVISQPTAGDSGMKAPAIASSVRRRFSISQPHRWLHSSAPHHHWSCQMHGKYGTEMRHTHMFVSFCR